MKPFNIFITDINAGSTNAALTAHMQELLQAVQTHKRGGSLKLTIKVMPATKQGQEVDKIFIACDSQLSLPKPEQPTDMFFLTEDAEPSRKHPRQYELEMNLREVANNTPASAFQQADAGPTKFSTPDADGVINPVQLPKDAAQ